MSPKSASEGFLFEPKRKIEKVGEKNVRFGNTVYMQTYRWGV